MSEIKLCKDCKHFVERPTPIASCCMFEVEPVYGGPAYDAYAFRKEGRCGREGVFFEKKPEPLHIPNGYKVSCEAEYGVLLAPIDPPRPWWKFWGKA